MLGGGDSCGPFFGGSGFFKGTLRHHRDIWVVPKSWVLFGFRVY